MQYDPANANINSNSASEIFTTGAAAIIENLRKNVIPTEYMAKHDRCLIHYHDIVYFESAYNCLGTSIQRLINRSAIDFRDMCGRLLRGIIALTNSQSGGIGIINFDTDASQYVTGENDSELYRSLYELLINLNTDLRKGCEKPYITFNFGLDTTDAGRRISRLLLRAFKEGNEDRQPFIFPNLVFKLRKGVNICIDEPNYDILLLSAQTTARCMIPTYLNTDAPYNADISPDRLGIVGCRTRLGINQFGEDGALDRGNIAANSINLVQLALESKTDPDKFMTLLDDTMETTYMMLSHRFNILAQRGNFELVRKHKFMPYTGEDSVTLMRNNTLAIGFIGLWECLRLLYGDSLNIWRAQELGLSIVKRMRAKTDEFTAKKEYNVTLLATSAEGITGKFAKYDSKVYGSIDGVTDKGFYTNSFHLPVDMVLNYFDKLSWEAPFHALCNGGCITYVELAESPAMNTDAVLELVGFAHKQNMHYFGINFPLDVCNCGERGVFEKNCPRCGGSEIIKLRRISGYLSNAAKFASGKSAELRARKPGGFAKNYTQ